MAVFLFPGPVSAAEYHVDRDKDNLVRFISDAPLEDFEGVTDRIDGFVVWKGDALNEGDSLLESEFYFEVELNGLDTGIGLRNRHMRENYLETEKYPFTYYSGRIQRVEKTADGNFVAAAQGKFYIHGIEKEMTIECTVSPTESGFMVESNFEVRLTEFEIDIPKLMFLKIDENIKLALSFYLKRFK